MTIATQQASVTIEGDGVNTTFAFDFEIPYQADGSTPAVALYYTDLDGATTTVGYLSITGVGAPTGGSLTYALNGDPIAVGTFLTINRDLDLVQPDEFEDQSFRASQVEGMGDTIVMELQQLQDQINRSVRFGPGPLVAPTGSTQEARGGYLFADGATGQPEWIASPIVVTAGSEVQVASVALLRLVTGKPSSIRTLAYHAGGDPGSGGLYVYDSTDTTSPDNNGDVLVTADNGRYRLQWAGWYNFEWSGAIGDGVGLAGTDNAEAILSTTYIGRRESALGRGFNLLIPPKQYNFNATNTGYFWWSGIKKFHISGYGATLQNTYAGGDANLGRPLFSCLTEGLLNTSGATYHGVLAGSPLSWLINNTTVGATSIITTTAADAGAWVAGEDILLTAVDTEFVGYPPNPALFEFNEVVSVNTGTGVMTLKRPVENVYLTTYPDGGAASLPCGKGRAWKVSSAVYYVPDPLNFPSTQSMVIPFDVEHLYEGLTLPACPGQGTTYMTVGGRSLHFKDMTMPGISPSIAGTTRFTNCTFTNTSEPDKLVDRVVLDECRGAALGFQSSSINHVEVIGGRYGQFYWGTAKYVTLTNPDIDQLLFGSLYGVTRNAVINGGTIRSSQSPSADFTYNPGNNNIDGVSVTYAAGVISILKSSGVQVFYWGLVPGQEINLSGVGDLWSGDAGTGVVTSLTENATHILIGTSWRWANLAAVPFTTTNKVRLSRGAAAQVFGTTGCDSIRLMANATKQGKRPWEAYKAQVVNFNTAGGDCLGAIQGELTNVNINVQQVSSTATRTMVFSIYLVKNDTINDQKQLVITIDLTTFGKRKMDLVSFTGIVGTDTVTFDGSPITALPPGRIISSGASWTHNITVPGTSATIPVVVFEFLTDSGMYGSALISNLDRTTNPITNVTGLVPS